MVQPFNKIMHRLVVGPSEVAQPLITVKERYKRFRSTLFLVLVAISIIPLITAAGLSSFQYQDLLEKEELSHLLSNAESAKKSLSGIKNAVSRCTVITHRLLGFARRMDVSLEEIDINNLIHEVLGFLDRVALYQRIQIDLSLTPKLSKIQSDRGQLQQIFLNILNNAVDAVGKEGRIEVST
jgi:signal transduction histidine kinase